MYLNLGNKDEELFVVKPRRSRSISTFTLKLTSMIDMFTILLVFLLKSFSMEGEIMSVARDLHLPESTATTPPKATPILVVTQDWLILDGDPVEKVETVRELKTTSIPALRERLQKLRKFSEQLGALDTSFNFKGKITIQGDREIPFEILKKVMFTCGQVGFNNMNLAVNQQERVAHGQN